MITRRTFVKGTVAVPALFALSACGGSDEDEEAAQDVATRIPAAGAPTFEPATEGSPAAEEAPPAEGEVAQAGGAPAPAGGTVTIEGGDIFWRYNGQQTAPNQPITVPVAPGTTISLPNVGAIAHNFQADDLGINEDMPVGETIEVQVPADTAPGDYPFICNVPGHEQAGMIGTLQVGAAAAQAPAAPPAEGTPPAAPGGAAAAITVEGGDIFWRFNGQQTAPNQPITVPASAGATISLPNVGAIAHNFVVETLDNVVVDMPVGQTATYTVPADAQPGEYEFICNVPGHAPAGMVGILAIQ